MANIPPELLMGTEWIPKSSFEARIRAKLGMAPGETTVEFRPVVAPDRLDASGKDLFIALQSALSASIKDKRDAQKLYDLLKNHYLIRIIQRSIQDDTMLRYVDYANLPLELPIQIQGPEKFVSEVVEFLENLRLPKIIREILNTTMYLGEYLLFLDRGEKGKRKRDPLDYQLDDVADQVNWRAVYLRGNLHSIVTSDETLLERYQPEDAFIFRIRYAPYRLDVRDPSGYNYYYYAGMPIIDSAVMNLINTIRMLEALLPISQILNVQSTQIIHVRLPAGTPNLEEAFGMARKYERILNSSVDLAPVANDPNEIIFQAARYRVIPLFGDKGNLEPQDLPRPNPIDTQQIQYFKQSLSDAVPLPSSYLGVVESNPDDRGKILSYFSLIDSIRKSIADLALSLVLRSYPQDRIPEDFDIVPVKILDLVETKSSDYMELIQFTLNSFADSVARFGDLLNQVSDYADLEVLVSVFNRALHPMTDYRDLIDPDKVKRLTSKGGEGEELGGFETPEGGGAAPEESEPSEEGPTEGEAPSEEEEALAQEQIGFRFNF